MKAKSQIKRVRVKRTEAPLRGYAIDDGDDTARMLRALALDDPAERERRLDALAEKRRARAAAFVAALIERSPRSQDPSR